MKKVWMVDITIRVPVRAKTESEAEKVGLDYHKYVTPHYATAWQVIDENQVESEYLESVAFEKELGPDSPWLMGPAIAQAKYETLQAIENIATSLVMNGGFSPDAAVHTAKELLKVDKLADLGTCGADLAEKVENRVNVSKIQH